MAARMRSETLKDNDNRPVLNGGLISQFQVMKTVIRLSEFYFILQRRN